MTEETRVTPDSDKLSDKKYPTKEYLDKVSNYFDNSYYENIDVVKQILKIYFTFLTKEQEDKSVFIHRLMECYVQQV